MATWTRWGINYIYCSSEVENKTPPFGGVLRYIGDWTHIPCRRVLSPFVIRSYDHNGNMLAKGPRSQISGTTIIVLSKQSPALLLPPMATILPARGLLPLMVP